MLLASTAKMNRKPIALAIVMLLAGLAPAMAIIGFCTRMPCCSHAGSDAAIAFSAERSECCTTITCYDAPSATLANRTAAADAVFAAPALVIVAAEIQPRVKAHAVIDTSPPATARQRLAALSLLRI